MKRNSLSITAALLILLSSLFTPLTATAKTHFYLMAGQSNMMGKGKTARLPATYKKTPANIQFFYQGRPRKLAQFAFFGPEVSFAHAIARAYPNDTHIIIKYVATGSSIRQWLPGQRLYQGLLKQLQLMKLPEDAQLEAVVWMQGEKDARQRQTAMQYESNLKHFIKALRNDLNAPQSDFIMGKINPDDKAFAMKKIVQQAQNNIQQTLPHTTVISTRGLGKIFDHVHYDAKGQIELGKRFARAYVLNNQHKIVSANWQKNR